MSGVPVKLSIQRIHRFRVTTGSLEILHGHIGRLVDNPDDMVVRYRDEAGDDIVISSQQEWEECLRISSALSWKTLCLSVDLPMPAPNERSSTTGSCDVLSASAAEVASPNADSEQRNGGGPVEQMAKDKVEFVAPVVAEEDEEKEDEPKEDTNDGNELWLNCEDSAAEIDRRTLENRLVADLLLAGSEKWRRVLALAILSSEQHLHLAGLHLGLEGAKAVAHVFEMNPGVHSADLTGNGIGDDGLKALALVLEGNTTLRVLHLGKNSISISGFAALAVVLLSNFAVEEIDLRGNEIDPNVAKPLLDAVRSKRRLIRISV